MASAVNKTCLFGYHKHRLTPSTRLTTTISSHSNQCCCCHKLCCLLTQNSFLPFCFHEFGPRPECDQVPRGGFIKLKAAYGSYVPADTGVPRSSHLAWPCHTESFASAGYIRETVKVPCGRRGRQGGKTLGLLTWMGCGLINPQRPGCTKHCISLSFKLWSQLYY